MPKSDGYTYEKQRAARRQTLRREYAEYLRSPVWRDRRRRVMERAGGLCEGCRDRAASEVHHLTYAHAFGEFLFELVALCRDCHRRWHEAALPPWDDPQADDVAEADALWALDRRIDALRRFPTERPED